MNKVFIVLIIGLLFSLAFLAGCTNSSTLQTDTNAPQILSDKEAAKTVSDVGTDLSGIRNSLNQVDQTLANGK